MGWFKAFYEFDFSLWTINRVEEIKRELRAADEQLFRAKTTEQLREHYVSLYRVDPLVLHFDELYATTKEQLIAAEQFPPLFSVSRGKSYPKPVYTFHLPFSGDQDLLKAKPSPWIAMTHVLILGRGEVTYDVIDFYNEAPQIKSASDNILDTLRRQSNWLKTNVEQFNIQLESVLMNAIAQRKAQLDKNDSVLSSLGVPVRQEAGKASTQAVDVVRRKRVTLTTIPAEGHVAKHPTLDSSTYNDILKTIEQIGKNMERHPSQYEGKDEEGIRDTFILGLESAYEFHANGESFNKSGKTDILIRHLQNTLFVAECKVWGGAKLLSETLDQILSYLTWRDSKATVMFFVHGRQIQAPLSAVKESTSKHPCYVRELPASGQSWFNFVFHLPGDVQTHINVAIQLFHFPR